MGYLADLISSLTTQIDSTTTKEGVKQAIVRELAVAQQAAAASGGGGGSTATSTSTLQTTGNNSLASIDTKLGSTLAADIAAIRSNTNKISQFSFQLAQDTAGTVFLIRTDTATGTTTNINVANGLPFTPVGAVELTDPNVAQISVKQNEYRTLSISPGNWGPGEIVERIRTVNTVTGAILTTNWYGRLGELLSFTPVIGTDVADTDRVQLDVLTSIDQKIPQLNSAVNDGFSTFTNLPAIAQNMGFNGTTWDRLRSGFTGPLSIVTGVLNTIGLARYSQSLATVFPDGSFIASQVDNKGRSVTRQRSTTTLTSAIPATTGSVLILAANPNRVGAKLVNNSNVAFYGLYGQNSAGLSNCSFALAPLTNGIPGVEEVPYGFEGVIFGAWAPGATGSLIVTEFI